MAIAYEFPAAVSAALCSANAQKMYKFEYDLSEDTDAGGGDAGRHSANERR